MKMITADRISTEPGKDVDYQQIPLVWLIERIVSVNDKMALNELHENRTVFQYQEKDLLLVDYLVRLRDRDISRLWCGESQVVLDNAFDLTLEKFINIPPKKDRSGHPTGTGGTDCRYYYRAYYAHTVGHSEQKKLSNVLEMEIMAARRLQKFVARHFFLSCLECVRQEQKTTRRYGWRINGQSMTLWMPSELTAKQCRQWLLKNVDDIDPRRDDERHRVQEIIDSRLMRRKILPLGRMGNEALVPADSDVVSSMITEQITADGLAEAVAAEKAAAIDFQRPAIRTLGKANLKKLVLMVFDNLLNGGRAYAHILATFSLSPASLNRFAGSKWHKKPGGAVVVPDLWKNTAHLLARHSDFTEAAKQAGVWKKICQVTGN